MEAESGPDAACHGRTGHGVTEVGNLDAESGAVERICKFCQRQRRRPAKNSAIDGIAGTVAGASTEAE